MKKSGLEKLKFWILHILALPLGCGTLLIGIIIPEKVVFPYFDYFEDGFAALGILWWLWMLFRGKGNVVIRIFVVYLTGFSALVGFSILGLALKDVGFWEQIDPLTLFLSYPIYYLLPPIILFWILVTNKKTWLINRNE